MKLKFPTPFIYVTSPFGMRIHPVSGVKSMHNGCDFGWSSTYGGSNVALKAPADGKITIVRDGLSNDPNGGYGNYLEIDHGNGIKTRLAHILKGSFKVKVGDVVKQDQELAKMNNSGCSTGNHLHYEVLINGNRVDPLLYNYAYPGQVIYAQTDKNYKIMRSTEPEPTPTPSVETKFKVGDKVIINGSLYTNSNASNPASSVSNKETVITRVASGAAHPYNTTGDLGWMNESDIKLASEPTPVKPTTEIQAGDIVIVNGSGAGDSYGGGSKTRTYSNQRMMVIYVKDDGRSHPYALNQNGNKNGVTGWFTKNSIKKN